MDWYFIYRNQDISLDYIRNTKNPIEWGYISEFYKLTDDFIEQFQDELNWYWITQKIDITPYNLEKYKDRLDWEHISMIFSGQLSEELIGKYEDYLNWSWVSYGCRQFSEPFIQKYINKLNLNSICEHQKLSFKFKLKNLNKFL